MNETHVLSEPNTLPLNGTKDQEPEIQQTTKKFLGDSEISWPRAEPLSRQPRPLAFSRHGASSLGF